MALLLTGAGGMVLAATVAAPASAATLPTVEFAGSVTDDVGRLMVQASSDSPITGITARVLSPQTGETLLVVDDLRLVAGQPERGVWHSPDTLRLPALGDYPLEVEVTDADGDTSPWPASGTLQYWITAVFDPLGVTPTVVDLDHRTVTVAGRLFGRAPDTRALTPMDDTPIDVNLSYDTYPSRTDAEGRFSVELDIAAPTPVHVMYYPSPEDQTIVAASSPSVEITVDEAPTRIVAEVTPSTVDAGEAVVLSGRLEYHDDGAWHPYAGVNLTAWYELTPFGGPAPELLRTDADGRFRLAAVLPRSGSWWVEYEGVADWFHEVSHTGLIPFQVVQSAAIADFTASRQGRQVTVGGRLALSDPMVLPSAAVDIEYSRSGRGGWTAVTTVTAAESGGYAFAGQVAYRPGYWRAHFRGDGDHPAATSGAVRVP